MLFKYILKGTSRVQCTMETTSNNPLFYEIGVFDIDDMLNYFMLNNVQKHKIRNKALQLNIQIRPFNFFTIN